MVVVVEEAAVVAAEEVVVVEAVAAIGAIAEAAEVSVDPEAVEMAEVSFTYLIILISNMYSDIDAIHYTVYYKKFYKSFILVFT